MDKGWSYEEKCKSAASSFMQYALNQFLPARTCTPANVERALAKSAKDEPLSLFEASFGELIELGDQHRARGGYWRALMRAAEMLELVDLEALLKERFLRALRALAEENK